MFSFRLLSSFIIFISAVNALPGALPGTPPGLSLEHHVSYKRLDGVIPPIPSRPAGVSAGAFHGSRFDCFDEIARKYGFDGRNPAVVHMPVWLFGRVDAGQVGR
jgi:hypothetical protein